MARVCVDGTFFEIDSSGNLTFKRFEVGFQDIRIFQNPGTFTFTKADFPGLTRVRIRAVGGGGGGAGANAATGEAIARAGGGGGAYAESLIYGPSIGATESIVVGAGGTGGVGNNAGNAGGASSFGGFVIAPGGRGSDTTMTSGTAPASASGGYQGNRSNFGTIRIDGGNGGPAIRHGAQSAVSGFGGTSGMGLGAGGQGVGSNNAGVNGSAYGGGGSGASSIGNSLNGGNGAAGVVIVEIYY